MEWQLHELYAFFFQGLIYLLKNFKAGVNEFSYLYWSMTAEVLPSYVLKTFLGWFIFLVLIIKKISKKTVQRKFNRGKG